MPTSADSEDGKTDRKVKVKTGWKIRTLVETMRSINERNRFGRTSPNVACREMP